MKNIIVNSKKFGTHTIIYDDLDHEILSKYSWFIGKSRSGTFYACTNLKVNGKKTIKQMQTFLIKPMAHMHIDHKNGNSLDNRRKNLRRCTHSENLCNQKIRKDNTSGYKGVKLRKNVPFKKWLANICVNKKEIFIGSFYRVEDAARAYNKAAIKYHGEFAKLNKIPCAA